MGREAVFPPLFFMMSEKYLPQREQRYTEEGQGENTGISSVLSVSSVVQSCLVQALPS